MSSSEADLLALMRADRAVQDRRRDRQELLDDDATEELRRIRNRTKKVSK
jgi:hypothetical protein